MISKPQPKHINKQLLIAGLVLVVLINMLLQVFKNCTCAYIYLNKYPLLLWVVIFFILGCSAMIALCKTIYLQIKIKMLEYIEWVLAILAILCACFQNRNGNIVTLRDFNLEKIMMCAYIILGTIGPILLSNNLMRFIRERNKKNSSTRIRSKKVKVKSRIKKNKLTLKKKASHPHATTKKGKSKKVVPFIKRIAVF